MISSFAAATLALVSLPSAFATTFDVQVGPNGQFVYQPEFVKAAVGDVVNFSFMPKNHTVTQSSFEAPCSPAAGGINSGFMPVASGDTSSTFQVTVNDTNPLWFYCQQANHCSQGMVFAINAPDDPDPKSFSAFKARAMGTGAASTSPTAGGGYVTPPPPSWQSATATVTQGASVWTTTYTSYDGTPPPTPAAQPQDHKITVGPDGKFVYSPANITAAIGDTVTFEFMPKNHTVTQSSFMNPCQALGETTPGAVGFKSGLCTPVAADATTFPTFQIKINDTAPIWGYCGQTGHCGSGMVFSINAVESGPIISTLLLRLRSA
ncbi:Cupredoxin [Infundibulicybe gibba]|nr:Cupredoxin [Infundibulicybe gibba]